MAGFLERLKQSIDKGAAVLTVRSREVIETAKVKTEIGVIQEKKKKALQELGEIVYQMYLKNNTEIEPDIDEKCELLQSLDSQLKEKEEKLKEVRIKAQENLGFPVCKTCGEENEKDAKFCNGCGEKLK